MERIKYQDNAEKSNIISQKEAEGLVLAEEQSLNEGQFLVFLSSAEVSDREGADARRELGRFDSFVLMFLVTLIKVLIGKGVIATTDFPQKLKDKYQRWQDLMTKAGE